MSMSTHIVGFKPPDDDWKRMKAVWDSCRAAGIQVPAEVEKFFDYKPPDDNGVEIDIEDAMYHCVRSYETDGCSGFEVLVDKIPEGVKIIRFWNGW